MSSSARVLWGLGFLAWLGCGGPEITTPLDGPRVEALLPPRQSQEVPRHPLCETLGVCDANLPPGTHLGAPVALVPSAGLPPEVALRQANNNLDVAWFEGRLFLAFRNGPNHYASEDTVLYVVSTQDLESWRFEARFALGTDLREPQLLVLEDRLLLYFAVLGKSATNFTPQGVRLSERVGHLWSQPEEVLLPGFIIWRIKSYGGRTYLVGYEGVKSAVSHEKVRLHWLTTDDGRAFRPVVPNKPVVHEGGVSETDFTFLADGSLVAVGRNETGDDDGFGSKVCRAAAHDLGTWRCKPDRKKYDSPLVFRHQNQAYLVGRRNLTDTGYFDLGYSKLPRLAQLAAYEADYWGRPKRCALWKVDASSQTVSHVLDLPSRGDTCFPEVLALNERQYLLFNYTSPLDGDDVGWRTGQLGPTQIHALVLTLP